MALESHSNLHNTSFNLDMVTHSSTNRARRRLTSLMETNTLPLCQTSTHMVIGCAKCVEIPPLSSIMGDGY